MRTLVTLVFALVVLASHASSQNTIHVDASAAPPGAGTMGSPFPRIIDALGVVTSGDTILVAPGTYNETLFILGVSLTLRSTAGPDVTIIDGGASDTVITIGGLVTPPTVVVDGFTITNGMGSPFTGGTGGMTISNALVTIDDCKITGNTGGAGSAGGINLGTGSLTMNRCEITNNQGGETPFSKFGSTGRGGGGGVAVTAFSGAPTLDMTDCLVAMNTGGDGHAVLFSTGTGGAGGLDVVFAGAVTTITNCVVAGNVGGDGETSSGRGGAGGLGLAGPTQVLHCTIADNTGGSVAMGPGTNGAGGMHLVNAGAVVTVTNSILWGDLDATGAPSEIVTTAGTATVTFSDVATGGGGTGNISLDPLFADSAGGDYRITHSSPCLGAGDATITLPLTDIEGDPRATGSGVDMGADELCRPGSFEDLVLATLVDGQGPAGACRKTADPGDAVNVDVTSLGGTFVGSLTLLGAQVFTGAGPTSPPAFPELDLDSGAVLVTAAPLPAGGFSLSFTAGAGASGLTARVQAFALDGSAANGIFASTGAHDLVLN